MKLSVTVKQSVTMKLSVTVKQSVTIKLSVTVKQSVTMNGFNSKVVCKNSSVTIWEILFNIAIPIISITNTGVGWS